MSEQTPDDNAERRFELLLSNLLRAGVASSLLIVVAGSIVSFVHHPDYVSSATALVQITGSKAAFPQDLHSIARGVMAGRGAAIVMLGLLLLLATPVMRVAVSVFAFLAEKDRTFVILTSAVLALLIFSFFLGKAG